VYQFFLKFLKYRLCVHLLILCPAVTFAQANKKIDSLNALLPSRSGIARFDVLYDLVFEHLGKDEYTQTLPLIDEAQRIAYRLGDSLRIVKTYRVRGQVLRRLDKTSDAINEFLKGLPISRRNKFTAEYEFILNGLAIAYTFQANYDKALQYHFECLILREEKGNRANIAVTLNNIGFVYFNLKNYDKALEYYKRILDNYAGEINFKDRLFITIGLCYNELNNFATAEKFIEDGFRYCAPKCNDLTLMQGEYGLGVSLFSLGKPAEAEKHFRLSYELSVKQKDKRFQIENLLYQARASNMLKKPEVARKFLIDAEFNASQTEYNELLLNIYKEYSQLYTQTKDYEKAAMYEGKYITLKDSIYSKDLIKNLATIQTNYEQRENIKTIADKDFALALKEETLKRQRAESAFIVVISALVFVLAVLMLQLFRLTRRANTMLEDRVDKRTKELNDSNEALGKVNGELDNFIYKTSHDIRGPLASLKGICNVAIMDVQDESALDYLKKLDSTAEKLNRILTRLLIINQINHAVMAANVINFEEIIEDILFLERKKGIPKRLAISYEVERGFVLKSDKDMLRIVLENLIDNGIKFHNESERIQPFVKIYVYADDRTVNIKVTDNGVGINAETKEKIFQMFVRASERSETGGIGLYLARLATGRLEGRIEFRTTEEKYTEFAVKLPLELGPILDYRREQERIREFEKIKLVGKSNISIIS
jgi:signal transduction histidine kinase/tetratricopeptide (TPR) repeat protein